MAANEPTRFAIIIGGMKCGTTSLFDLLAQHPEICPCSVKEPDFFSNEADPAAAWDRYRRLWHWDPGQHRWALEASTSYTDYPYVTHVPERMAVSPADAFKLIYIMREPIARIASHVRHGVYDGWGKSLDDGGLTQDLIDRTNYAMQLDRYMAVFQREDILLLTLDELEASPAAVLRRVSSFLGVAPDHDFAGLHERRNAGDFYQVSSLVGRVARSRPARYVLDHVLSRGVRHRLRTWMGRSGPHRSTESPGRWQLNAAEIARVRALLAQDLARLRTHYGVDAPWLPAVASATAELPAGAAAADA